MTACTGVVGVDRECAGVSRWRVFHRSGSSALLSLTNRSGMGIPRTSWRNHRVYKQSGYAIIWVRLGLQTTLQVRGAVKSRSFNALGIYDVHGNVREWTWDRIRESVAEDRFTLLHHNRTPTDRFTFSSKMSPIERALSA